MTTKKPRPIPPCPKCYGRDVHRSYHKDSECSFDTCRRCHEDHDCDGGAKEHFRFFCRGCEYEWATPLEPKR